eukprot:UN26468
MGIRRRTQSTEEEAVDESTLEMVCAQPVSETEIGLDPQILWGGSSSEFFPGTGSIISTCEAIQLLIFGLEVGNPYYRELWESQGKYSIDWSGGYSSTHKTFKKDNFVTDEEIRVAYVNSRWVVQSSYDSQPYLVCDSSYQDPTPPYLGRCKDKGGMHEYHIAFDCIADNCSQQVETLIANCAQETTIDFSAHTDGCSAQCVIYVNEHKQQLKNCLVTLTDADRAVVEP